MLKVFSPNPQLAKSMIRFSGRIAVSHTHLSLRPSSAQLSMMSFHPRTIYQRTINYFNDYPFVKYSILLCATVLGGSLAFESYSKHKKKLQPQILSLPASVCHATLPRPDELNRLQDAARTAKRKGKGIVYLVGPPGSGKTELVCQYGKQFIEQTHNFTYRFRILKPTVVYLNGTSTNQLHSSLQEVAMCLGVSGYKLGSNGSDLISLASAVQERLDANKVPWLIIIDNLTPSTIHTFESLFCSNDDLEWNWSMGHVIVTTHQPPKESNTMTMNLSDRYDNNIIISN